MKNKVAGIIFINEKNKILLYLRDNKKSIPYPGYWVVLGGHAKKNETPLEALKREIKEEIEFDIQDNNLKFLGILDDLVGNDVYLYSSKIKKNLNELNLREGQKLGYFSFEEAMKIKIPVPLKQFLIKNKNKIFNKS